MDVVTVYPDGGTVGVKRTEDAASALRLRTEAANLQRARHPGVVALTSSGPWGDTGWQLTTAEVDGPDLGRLRGWAGVEVAGFGAAAATILADLHDLGVVHRRILPTHVLTDAAGRPVLCGFSGASGVAADGPDFDGLRAADVAALAGVLSSVLDPRAAPSRPLSQALRRATASRGRRTATARRLAAELAAVPGATLPHGRHRAPSSDGPRAAIPDVDLPGASPLLLGPSPIQPERAVAFSPDDAGPDQAVPPSATPPGGATPSQDLPATAPDQGPLRDVTSLGGATPSRDLPATAPDQGLPPSVTAPSRTPLPAGTAPRRLSDRRRPIFVVGVAVVVGTAAVVAASMATQTPKRPTAMPPTAADLRPPVAAGARKFPQATAPHAARPQAAEPQATRPHASRPQAAGPQATRPHASRPQAAGPQATRPQAARPQAATAPRTSRPLAAACPGVDEGCGPVTTTGGVLVEATRTYTLGAPGDVVVVGRWYCTATPAPALLRPSTGQIWLYPRWATNAAGVPGQLVATVPGALSLAVRPAANGCDHLAALRRHGAPVPIPTGQKPVPTGQK